jgi:hypothetical protein
MAFSYVPSAKALAFGRDLTAALDQRFGGTKAAPAAVESFSTETATLGAPVITVDDKLLVRVEQFPTIQKDVLGIPQTVFTPHIAKCVVQDDDGVSTAVEAMLKGVSECIVRGVRVEVWLSDVIAEASISGDPDYTFDSIQYPLMATV